MASFEPPVELVNRLLFQIDNRQYVSSLKEIKEQKRKQYAQSLVLTALESVCLTRLDKEENRKEIFKLLETSLLWIEERKGAVDLEVLDRFVAVSSAFNKYDLACKFYEAGEKKFSKTKPAPEEFLNKLFFCHVRVQNFKKQQKVAQVLDKRFKKKKYSMWWAISMMLQEKDYEPGTKMPLLLKFSIRIFENNFYRIKYADPELVLFYAQFLFDLGNFSQCIQILREKTSSSFDSVPYDRKSFLVKTYMKMGEWLKAKVVLLHLIEKYNSEQWSWWTSLMECEEKIIENKPEDLSKDKFSICMNIPPSKKYSEEREIPEDDRFQGQNSREINDKEYEIASDFWNMEVEKFIVHMKEKNPKFRTAFLAQIENCKRKNAHKDLGNYVLEYIKLFGNKSSSYLDLCRYYPLLDDSIVKDIKKVTNSAVIELNKKLSESKVKIKSFKMSQTKKKNDKKHKKKKIGNAKKEQPGRMNKELVEHEKLIQNLVNYQLIYQKIKNYFIVSKGGEEVLKKSIKELKSLYEKNFKKFKDFVTKKTSNQYGDDFLAIAVQNYITLFILSKKVDYLIEAIIVLENGLKFSPYNFVFKTLLMRLNSVVGNMNRSIELFKSLEIKHNQVISLSYLFFYDYFHFENKRANLFLIEKEFQKFFSEIWNHSQGIVLMAFRNSTWSRVKGSISFSEVLVKNLFYHEASTYSKYLKLSVSDSIQVNKQTIGNMSCVLNHEVIGKVYPTKEYSVKEDFSVFDWYCKPGSKTLSDIVSLLFREQMIGEDIRKMILNLQKCVFIAIFEENNEAYEKAISKIDSIIKEIKEKKEKEYYVVDLYCLLLEGFKTQDFNFSKFSEIFENFIKEVSSKSKNCKNGMELLETFVRPVSFFIIFIAIPLVINAKKNKKMGKLITKLVEKKLRTLKNLINSLQKKKRLFLIDLNGEPLFVEKGSWELQTKKFNNEVLRSFKSIKEKIGDVLFELK